VTGFSGLVYQVAWQKYLATLLGSHSEATAAVLGIFLGGLAVGYAIFGSLSRRRMERTERRGGRPGLLLLYGAVESGIGLYALLFPALFASVQTLSYRVPQISDGFGFTADVVLTTVLIAPPTILMGGTIPLLTQGLSRSLADATRFHSFVYAFNTVGAFAGALAAAFALIPELGLERTVIAMGWVNLAAGATFLFLSAREAALPAGGSREQGLAAAGDPVRAARAEAAGGNAIAFCAVVLLAGFAMMSLQTVLNRVGGFALGASHFTFAMVVATFVLGIALGSFGVSALPRIRPVYLVASQWALVALLVILYGAMQNATYWGHALRLSFPNEIESFLSFHGAAFLSILGIFGVPLALSGALLPLIFHHLRREEADLGRIAGRIYCWNTVGSLLGALLGGYLLLYWFDLDHIYRFAVLALAMAAALSTVVVVPRWRLAAVSVAAALAALLAALPEWDRERLSAGLFRYRSTGEDLRSGPDEYFAGFRSEWSDDFVLFYDDDPTASVAVFDMGTAKRPSMRAIVTNGKTDGNIPACSRSFPRCTPRSASGPS
jgi:spermidine synthase